MFGIVFYYQSFNEKKDVEKRRLPYFIKKYWIIDTVIFTL